MAFIPKNSSYYGYGPLANDPETFAVAEVFPDGDFRLCECVSMTTAREIAEMYGKEKGKEVRRYRGVSVGKTPRALLEQAYLMMSEAYRIMYKGEA